MTEDERPRRDRDSFEVGEIIRVSKGPFASFRATVNEVNEEHSRLGVAVLIFGRIAPIELEFGEVEKL
jgi:transcription termination/antitermination protein NusG